MENLIKEIKTQIESLLVDNAIEGFQRASETWDEPIEDLSFDPQYSLIEIDAEDYPAVEVEIMLDALVDMKHVYKDHTTVHVRRDQPWAESDEEIVVVAIMNGYEKLENRSGSKGWLVYKLDLSKWDVRDAHAPEARKEEVKA